MAEHPNFRASRPRRATDDIFICKALRHLSKRLWNGYLNLLLWLSYVAMVSRYAFVFGIYGETFLPKPWRMIGKHPLIGISVILFIGLNLSAPAKRANQLRPSMRGWNEEIVIVEKEPVSNFIKGTR